MRTLVTGGAGFIGSALVRHLVGGLGREVVTVDKLTYAGSLDALAAVEGDPRHAFEPVDVCDRAALDRVFRQYRPGAVVHLAAESHVDRSIDGPAAFVQTNVVGTYTLLEAARAWRGGLAAPERDAFRFLHVSTDEVFGSLGDTGRFSETSPYDPSSPYSATKASADHLVRAWGRTYGLPTLVTNCSNNYGPFQYPEKLVPVVVARALAGRSVPVYGAGQNVRDWLFVDDHARALTAVLDGGQPGETYAVGGDAERRNLDVVRQVCQILDEVVGAPASGSHADLIEFVTDRPGHDYRYAIDASKIEAELGWAPRETFESGLRRTVRWYVENQAWCGRMLGGGPVRRLGTAGAQV